jgi:hypothetical protein
MTLEKPYISIKTIERKIMEARRLENILMQIKHQKRIFISAHFYREITKGGLVIIDGRMRYVYPSEILKYGNRVQLLAMDLNSPFGNRNLITHFGCTQDTRPVTKEYLYTTISFSRQDLSDAGFTIDCDTDFEDRLSVNELIQAGFLPENEPFLTEALHKLGLWVPEAIYPHPKTQKAEFDAIRKQEWNQFLKLCDEQANISGQLVTISSGISYVNSVEYPLHAQSIKLKDGIKISNDYDPKKLINIHDLPKFIKRAKKLNLMYNIRFTGNGKALILGLYPFKDSKMTLPTKPANLGDPRVREFYAFLYAFMPGPVECFTNGMAPNEQNIAKLREFGYRLDFSDEDLKYFTRDWIDSHHAQFDPELILNDFNYKMYCRQNKTQDLVSSVVATMCKYNPFHLIHRGLS